MKLTSQMASSSSLRLLHLAYAARLSREDHPVLLEFANGEGDARELTHIDEPGVIPLFCCLPAKVGHR